MEGICGMDNISEAVRRLQDYIETNIGTSLYRPLDMGDNTWRALKDYINQLHSENENLRTQLEDARSELIKHNILSIKSSPDDLN